ncbi:MAG: hypothetical protein EBT15_08235 [Betaproteobacteria bacterium]|nr:hypothetical protein [Betaproteobacteria bacterium]
MSPYELRYEVLKTAREMVEHQFHANMELWKLGEKAISAMPKAPTLDDVLSFADKMNTFVSSK